MTADVFCTARDEVRAVRILNEIEEAGFGREQLSLVVMEGAVTGGLFPARNGREDRLDEKTDRSPLCDMLNGLSNITVGRVTDLGKCVGAGRLGTALAAAGECELDGFAEELPHAGVPRADLYKERIAEGRILLSVHCVSLEEAERVRKILARAGADDLLITDATSSQDGSEH